MICKTAQQTLLSLEDPTQPPASVQAHIVECADCRDWHRRLLRIEHHARHLPAPPAKEKETFLRVLQETPVTEKRLGAQRFWQPFASRPTGIAVAASLLLALSWWLWPTPPGEVANPQGPLIPDPLLVKLRDHDLHLALANNPRDRVETLAKLANDLCEETQSVALEATPEVLRTMTELYREIIDAGIVRQAKDLAREDRKVVLTPIADQLQDAGGKWALLADRTKLQVSQHLRDCSTVAQEGRKQLRLLQ